MFFLKIRAKVYTISEMKEQYLDLFSTLTLLIVLVAKQGITKQWIVKQMLLF